MLTGMKTLRGVALGSIAGLFALSVSGCAQSLDSVADACGGRDAGIISDDTGLVVDVSSGESALTCVTDKLFSSEADQLSVAATADAGAPQDTTIAGRPVRVVEMSGSTVVFIGDEE